MIPCARRRGSRMRLCIVGGALQGMEAVFLGHKAGYETVVIDRRAEAPALSICDESHVLDPITSRHSAMEIFRTCDAVLPACEEHDLLECLDNMLKVSGIPFLFDLRSYDISQSKIESNALMAADGVPMPRPWPECGFPVIVKPSSQSGSIGVSIAHDEVEMAAGLNRIDALGDEPVVQEFVHGKSVSIEVIGNGNSFAAYVTTEVVLDKGYDCKEVRCSPGILDDETREAFERHSRNIAKSLKLNGLMDVEAILTPKGLRFLEIDARIPSQTPAAIFTATGINLLEMLMASKTGSETHCKSTGRCGIYWHLRMKDGILTTTGEKEFSHVVCPHMESGLFGSDDSISDYGPGKTEWHGTFMVSADTLSEAEARRASVIQTILSECGTEAFVDSIPKEA